MKRLVALLPLALLVLATAANAQDVGIDLRGIVPPVSAPRSPALTFDRGLFRWAPVTGPEAPPVPAQLKVARRRGSMVGYLDDPVIGSKVRIRFESGLHNDTPDRAEYFYAKCGCYAILFSPGDPPYDADAPGPEVIISDLNFRQMYFQGEYAFGTRVSAFAEVPFRWIQPQVSSGPFENQGGLGDIRAGVKVALASSESRTVTLQVRSMFPTGDPKKGLGTDHVAVEPAVLYLQQAGERFTVETQAGFWLPIGGSAGVPTSVDQKFAGNMFFYGIGPSYEVYRGSRLSVAPVVELIGWHLIDGFQTSAVAPADASGTDIINIKFGARINWDNGGSIYVGYGRSLTDAKWYRDVFRLEYRHGF